MFEEEKNRPDRITQLPVYNKAEEIYFLVNRMLTGSYADELEESEDMEDIESDVIERMFEQNKEFMLANAMMIPSKIAGAEGADLYDLRMENAAVIRKAAREIITDARGLQMNGFKDIEYLDLLRRELEEFRVLFAEWVAGFDKENYCIDRWGLFNPPGVNYNDHDPDDDLPFDPDSFFGDV
ncbi:hypothetical protein [Nonlabens antarcticus]|uniref:hypothetical protein n=1 Tax=Nonlabens antarcticus TaxID=392714 RepID=UPI001890B828|nr:hypothetical protein [Nonlabens antarcticus]